MFIFWSIKIDDTPKSALIAQFMWSSLLIILIEGGIISDVYGYCVLTGIGNEFRINKVPNIIILFFIVGRLCGLIFSYFSVTCPENESNCEEYIIKRQVPYFTGCDFYFINSRGQLDDNNDEKVYIFRSSYICSLIIFVNSIRILK
jgi:hypothetical protein